MKKIVFIFILFIPSLLFGQLNGNFKSVRFKSGQDTTTFSPKPVGTVIMNNADKVLYVVDADTTWVKVSGPEGFYSSQSGLSVGAIDTDFTNWTYIDTGDSTTTKTLNVFTYAAMNGAGTNEVKVMVSNTADASNLRIVKQCNCYLQALSVEYPCNAFALFTAYRFIAVAVKNSGQTLSSYGITVIKQ